MAVAPPGVNLTALWLLLNRLPPEQRTQLLQQLNVSSFEELLNQTDMYVRSYEESLMQYTEYRILKHLLLIVPPILLVLGTFGNIFSFIILMRRSMRKFSTYIYLAMLSLTDTLVLYIGLLRLWIGELTGMDIRDKSDWICKVINVVGYTVSDYSVWLIIAVTVERYVAVCYPLRAPAMCNRRRAIVVIVCLLLALLFINLHFLWTAQIMEYNINGDIIYQCEGAPNHTRLVQEVWPWVDAFLYSFLPFVVISVLNALIIRQVAHARRNRSGLQSNMPDTRSRAQESSIKLTIMLLTISFAFLLTTLPMNIALIGTAFYNQYHKDLHIMTKFKLIRTITELLMYVNHSMNFYLYCATGQKFRHELVSLLCHRWRYCDNRTTAITMDGSHSHCTYRDITRNGVTKIVRNDDNEMVTFARSSRSSGSQNNKSLIAEVQKGDYIQMKICNSNH
uniref:Orphan G-protein coupled receptor 57 n=1 Tax=Platynereis dumerilii TaxID=6359 RepID=A0A0K0PUW3_PLADU|nr:orphan G-protein coupled receptor 57 [Platynereis dumerilii]